MIPWLFTNWLSQLAALVAAVWLLNGLRKAVFKPRVTYVSHIPVPGDGYMLTVKRQQLLPPWLTVTETWRLTSLDHYGCRATRESDCSLLTSMDLLDELRPRLIAVMDMRLRKDKTDKAAIADLERQMAEEERLAATIAAAQRKRAN